VGHDVATERSRFAAAATVLLKELQERSLAAAACLAIFFLDLRTSHKQSLTYPPLSDRAIGTRDIHPVEPKSTNGSGLLIL